MPNGWRPPQSLPIATVVTGRSVIWIGDGPPPARELMTLEELAVLKLDCTPISQTVVEEIRIKNTGLTTAPPTKIWVVLKQQWDSGDYHFSYKLVDTPALAPGESVLVEKVWIPNYLPWFIGYTLYASASADYYHVVSETDEYDNWATFGLEEFNWVGDPLFGRG